MIARGIIKMTNAKQMLAARAEQALVEQLPVDQKTLRRVGKLMEPKNLKRLALTVVGGSVAISVMGSISRTSMYRMAVARELKKQLEPVNKKLCELEAQNEELKRQNDQLAKALARQNRHE